MGLFKKILPDKIYRKLFLEINNPFLPFYNKSYSQEGEDMILRRIFEKKNKGFYVDIGAYHPKRFSNTYYFYKCGWNGINIDARPGSMRLFNKIRGRDINLEIPVSSDTEELTYYSFDEPALNGFIKELSDSRISSRKYKILFTQKMITKTLSEIFDEHLCKNIEIDFMSIDVEGLDLSVLQSNDWSKYRPVFILIECLQNEGKDIYNSHISKYLNDKNYFFFAKTVNTFFYKKIDSMH